MNVSQYLIYLYNVLEQNKIAKRKNCIFLNNWHDDAN
jgi:hypothetical protein